MIYIYEYKTIEERESILETKKSFFLVEEKNITEGNYLTFTDEKPVSIAISDLEKTTLETNDYLLDVDFRLLMLELGFN